MNPQIIIFYILFACTSLHAAVPYDADVAKLKKRIIRKELIAQSMTIKLENSPPATIAQLRRRANRDITSMTAVLQSHGYYDGEIVYSINTNRSPAYVEFNPKLNKRYLFRNLNVKYPNQPNSNSVPVTTKITLKNGSPALASAVALEEARLLKSVKESGYPFANITDSIINIDKDQKMVDVLFVINLGKIATFGSNLVSGEESVKSSYIYRRVPWKKGDLYNLQDVADLEQDLLVSGLFNIAKVYHGTQINPDGSLPMKIDVMERKHRTVRVGANYRSDTGAGGILSWEHRNLFHGAESLGLTLAASEIESLQNIKFKRPDFLTPHLALLVGVEAMQEDPDAYSSKSYEASTTLEYELTRYFTASMGLAYKRSFVEQFESDEDYNLIGLPISLERDTRDNQLDTREGWRAILIAEPFNDLKRDSGFVRYITEDRGYLSLSQNKSVILAGRVLIGSISGAAQDQVPADERFYAGGGGSVRGYEYQTVGSVTTNGIPVGGLSVFEVSAEARIKSGGQLGYVLFVDGGMAFNNRLHDADESLLWGAGFGLRYNIGFAPLRVDLAFPLNKRGFDDDFQFYISIGQAF